MIEPITFKLLERVADVSINVFGQEFLVHSRRLQDHSGYFCKFLKNSLQATTTSTTCYRYISQVDEDGSWYLRAAKSDEDQHSTNEPPESKDKQTTPESPAERIATFHSFMNGLYLRRSATASLQELDRLVKIADYYCALPAISSAVEAALLESPDAGILRQLQTSPEPFLELACRLRSKLLYKEAFIYAVGLHNRHTLNFKLISHPQTKSLVVKGAGHVDGLVRKASQDLLWTSLGGETGRNGQTLFSQAAKDFRMMIRNGVDDRAKFTIHPTFYQKLRTNKKSASLDSSAAREIQRIIEPVIRDNRRWKDQLNLPELFLCADLKDEDLPWNRDEIDW